MAILFFMKKHRSIFLSDIHLGTRFSKAEALLEFLRDHESDYLYLVGDVIDGWAIKRKLYWPQSHSDVVQKILRKSRKGTEVYFILGNHDEFLRSFVPLALGDRMRILKECEYVSLKNEKFLVTHGDFFDTITMTKKWIAHLGDKGYDLLLHVNQALNYSRRKLGIKSRWSLSKYVKQNVKKSVSFITDFEHILAEHAKRYGYDGVVCGHIHHAEIRTIEGINYLNCGDWVESCTALVEHFDGRWEILDFGHSY
jgi:UDP-2,3-diacylglucosamine pyrophosphatase LpxH